MASIISRKTLVEVRFQPKLAFSSTIEPIASELVDETWSGWRVSPDSVELINRKQLERLVFEPKRFFFECDGNPDLQVAGSTRGIELILSAMKKYGVEKIRRVGVRQWFALSVNGLKEKTLIRKLSLKYCNFQSLYEASKMGMSDFNLVIELQDDKDEKRTGRINFGAMEKKQWEKIVPYVIYPDNSGHISRDSLDKIVADLPSDFVMIDVDRNIMAKQPSDMLSSEAAKQFVAAMHATQKEIPHRFLEDLRSN